jgi:3-methyl-2-oxobutanoate hydroxymethyltransferase
LIICGDMLGLFQAFTPKFVKKYANVAEVETNAFKAYVDDVRSQKFPADEHVYHVIDPIEKFEELFKQYR